MKHVVRTLGALGDELVLAPERWLAAAGNTEGVPLGSLVTERRERVLPTSEIVVDVTHARDGYLDLAAARRASTDGGPRSAKKRGLGNDVLVSRLRPYLRQVALVPAETPPLALSTEFYVLAPLDGEDLAWLVPYLLSPATQGILAAAQEGGHHPRVPRASLFALKVPAAIVEQRAELALAARRALSELYGAMERWTSLLEGSSR